MKKLCFVTSTRADYGLLKPLMIKVKNDYNYELQIIVTGTHLLKHHGLTYFEIKKDGFTINYEIKMDLIGDNPSDIVKAMGNELIGFSKAYDLLKPDMLIILGDRYEILVAVQAANIYNIPVSHFCGGDITNGSYDNNTRHAITKLSHLHFVTNELSKQRILQMGENQNYVFNYGNPGLEVFFNFVPIKKNILEKILKTKFNKNNIVVVYHPDTLNYNIADIDELILSLRYFANNRNIYLLRSNSDNNNNMIHEKMNTLSSHKNVYYYNSLQRIHFLSLIYYSNIFVGNSSSGIYEIPFLKKYVINIGNRQCGRLKSNLVIDCKPKYDEIIYNIKKYSNKKINNVIQIYPLKETSELFVNKLSEYSKYNDFKNLLNKEFHTICIK